MATPKILLSRCFNQPVRYNGGIINDELVEKIKKYVNFIDLCPEVDIGLGVPRKRVIITIDENQSKKLIQPETGADFTEKMKQYCEKIINSLPEIDGFILKAKSPSCGISSVKLYKNEFAIEKTDGFFAEEIKKNFPLLPVEDEGRLRDEDIRKHFLTRIFAFADLRETVENYESKKLIQFHSQYKYLLMTYNQKVLKELGQIVADAKIPVEQKIKNYKVKFYQAFLKKPSKKRHLNTIMHIIGHISEKMNVKEKRHLLQLIEKFKEGRIQLKVITELLRNLAYRFEKEYLIYQKYLEPYPDDLDV